MLAIILLIVITLLFRGVTNVALSLSGDLNFVGQWPEVGDGLSSLLNSTIPASADTEYDVFVPLATPGLNLLIITSTIPCTLFINGTGTGTSATAELTLQANIPFLWYNGIGFTVTDALGSTDISKIWIRNGATPGVLNLRAQYAAQGN